MTLTIFDPALAAELRSLSLTNVTPRSEPGFESYVSWTVGNRSRAR